MNHRTMRLPAAVAALMLGLVSAARADADSEREALARIAQELQRLQLEVAQAAKNADTTARVKFRYDWLGKDLELVLRGVTDHLDAPRQPRPVPPLVGDYRR
ncbi:MAG TPA: RAQPRD family integrative conjugative element protein [Ramlibacter sp.]|nr:RAQPRD family integrative conjugative element protein [Ramlibacter sp.]